MIVSPYFQTSWCNRCGSSCHCSFKPALVWDRGRKTSKRWLSFHLFTIQPLFAIYPIYWRCNSYLFLFSWPVCGETDPELPPHPRQLCRIALPDHRGPDQLSPKVTYRSETRTPVVFPQRSHCCVYGRYRSFPTDLSALLLGDLYYTRLSLSGVSEHLSHRALLDLYQILHANLSSNLSKVCDADQPSWHKQMHFYLQLFYSLSGPPADSENSVSVWGRAPSPLRGTTLRLDSQTIPDQNTLQHEFFFLRAGWGECRGAARFCPLPPGWAGTCHSAGLQRETAAPPKAETRSGAAQSATGTPHHLPAGLCYKQPFN